MLLNEGGSGFKSKDGYRYQLQSSVELGNTIGLDMGPDRFFVNVRLTKVFWLFRQCYPVKVAAQKSLTILAQFLVDEVQHIYRSQGVDVADKHLEIIIRSMSSRVEVDQPGYSPFSPGELLEIHSMDRFLKYEDFTYVPIILGMTKVGLTTQGFLSSTSFQQSKQPYWCNL